MDIDEHPKERKGSYNALANDCWQKNGAGPGTKADESRPPRAGASDDDQSTQLQSLRYNNRDRILRNIIANNTGSPNMSSLEYVLTRA